MEFKQSGIYFPVFNQSGTDTTTNFNDSDSISADNSENYGLQGLISAKTRRQIEDIFCVLLPVIFLVGMFGNVVSLLVLFLQGTKEATHILLIGLTITDLLFIVFSFVAELDCIVRYFNEYLAMKIEVITRCYLFIPAYILGRISALFICLVAMERYIVVKYPLKANQWITRKTVLLSIVAVYFTGFACGSCLLFIYKIEESFDTAINATVLKIMYSQYAIENFEFLIFYLDIFMASIFRFFPVGFVLFCTCSILNTLRKSKKIRNQMTGQSHDKRDAEQQKITMMLLSICILFVVCTAPDIMHGIARLIYSTDGYADIGQYENISAVVVSVVFIFSLINSSVNFVLYTLTSKKFAATFRQLFYIHCRCKMKDRVYAESS